MSTNPLPQPVHQTVEQQHQELSPGASVALASSSFNAAAASGNPNGLAGGQTRKRKATSAPTQSAPEESTEAYRARRKNAHSRLNNLIQALDAAAHPPPTLVVPDPAVPASQLRSAARDIWPHIIAALTAHRPDDLNVEQQVIQDASYQNSRALHLFRRPSGCGYIRCIPCLASNRQAWHVWINRQGNTRAIRDHMMKYHQEEYTAKCREQGFDLSTINLDDDLDASPPAFTREGLVDRIVRWISVDDQSLNVVEQPEFREILIYCGQGALRNHDIPHRTKVAEELHQIYLREKAQISEAMRSALGCISLTTNLWSDQLLRSFMAVTAHYIDSSGDSAEHLIAFRKIDGHHSGANIGQALFLVLEEVGLVGKIGHITVDNASNNDTLMVELEKEFNARNLHFDAEENRVCCFPHVINLAVQRVLEQIPRAATSYRGVLKELGVQPTSSQNAYLDAVASNVVACTRNTIGACRASGQRREEIARLAKEGNLNSRWRAPNGIAITVPELELKADVVTRWGSTLDMIDRFIALYLPVTEYSLRHHEAAIPIVTHKQYEVLQDVSTVLSVAQRAQELLSAERTPTLSLALPVYDTVLDLWRECRVIFPELSSAINAGIMKIEEYVYKSRRSPAHVLAMFVNPSLKFEWIDKHFHPTAAEQAFKAVADKLLEYAQDRRETIFKPSNNPHNSMSKSARAQAHGYHQLLDLGSKIQRADGATLHITTSPTPTPSPGSTGLSPVQQDMHDRAAVQIEMAGYIALGTTPIKDDSTGGDIISQWKGLRHLFPLIHQLAMDILPVQASSVSSERVFSSSKLTCTRERSRMAVGTVESLQVLKHSLKRRRVHGLDTRTMDFMSKFDTLGDELIDLLPLSRHTFASLKPLVWEDIDLKDVLELVKGLKRSMRIGLGSDEFEHVFEFAEDINLARFDVYAPFVKIARTSALYVVKFPDKRSSAPNIFLPNLQHLIINTSDSMQHPDQLNWISRMLAPSLQRLEMRSIYLKQSAGEDLEQENPWIPQESCVKLVDEISQTCPNIKTLSAFPRGSDDSNQVDHHPIYAGIGALKNLRTVTLGIASLDQELVQTLGLLPYLNKLVLAASSSLHLKEDKDGPVHIPEDSFPSLQHLALHGLNESTLERIHHPSPLFRRLTTATVIFPEKDYFHDERAVQRRRSRLIAKCFASNSLNLTDLSVFSSWWDGCTSFFLPGMLDLLRGMPLRRLRLDRTRLRSWGDADDLTSSDSSDDEEVGHVEIQWREFLATVPHLEELHLHFQAIKSHHLPGFVTMLPKLRLFVVMAILFDTDDEVYNHPATQPITIRCPFFGDNEGDELSEYSYASKYMHSLWPNVTCEVDTSMSWIYGGEPLEGQVGKISRFNEAMDQWRDRGI